MGREKVSREKAEDGVYGFREILSIYLLRIIVSPRSSAGRKVEASMLLVFLRV